MVQTLTGKTCLWKPEECWQVLDTGYSGGEGGTIRGQAVGAGGFAEGGPGALNVAGVMPGRVAGSISYVAVFGDGAVELRKDAGGT